MDYQVREIDEKDYQLLFYHMIYGENWKQKVWIDRNTDGHTAGILFEHKKNVSSYGVAKTLSQALIYLSRFNRDGIPVPRYSCLVSQEEELCFFVDNNYYLDYINDIKTNAYLTASRGFPFPIEIIEESIVGKFSYSAEEEKKELHNFFISNDNRFVKVSINEDNVVGWARYYYKHCPARKAKKIKFFEELRNPREVLNLYIEPWNGKEMDFRFIMDLLNDPQEQKKIGAFYTPTEYAEKACELVIEAIKRVPAGNDYVIIDRCAGTGNLEYYLNDFNEEGDDILSHVIISSPEYKEWQVLKERLGEKVRHLLPEEQISNLGYLEGADALSKEFLDNSVIKQYLDDEKCSIILFENPPYAQGSSITNQVDKVGKEACDWKSSYVVQQMKKEVAGTATNEMCNAFIWSAFKYYLRQPTDSYIVFAPVKYWKNHGLAKKKMIAGYGFNRQYFHASAGFVSCIAWTNIDDEKTDALTLDTFAIKDEDRGGGVERIGDIELKKVYSLHSEKYYDKRTFESDKKDDGILVNSMSGIDYKKENKKIEITFSPIYNSNIVAYMISKGCTFTSPGLSSRLSVAGSYDGHGCYLREDNFYQYLPSFAGMRFTNNVKDWTAGAYGPSADMADHYWLDVKSGKLDDFLFKTLLWVCFTHYSHMVSQIGSDGRLYLNQLCYQEGTLARKYLDDYIAKGYDLTDDEKELITLYERLMRATIATEEYNKDFTYGVYQIGLQIDTTYKDDNGKVQHNHGDVFNLLKVIKQKAKDYYIKELVPTLLKYEFVK